MLLSDKLISKRLLVGTTAVYGLEWDKTLDTYKRLDGAEGLVVGASIAGSPIISDFDNVYPWSEMRRCNLADNLTVNAWLGDVGYIENGSNGQVMVWIPKFYYKTEFVGDKRRWWISKYPKAGFKLHPAFIRNGVVIDGIFHSAYEGNVASSVMRSIAGVQPSTSTNVTGKRSDFQGYASARGTGWFNLDFLTLSAVQLLYLIEFAHFNSQVKIGRGIVDEASGSANHSKNTGLAAGLGNGSGRQSGTDGKTAVNYRGIENPWGNIYKWVSGLNIKGNYEAYVADHDYVDDKFADQYSYMATVLSTSNTFVKDFVNNATFDFGFLASVGGGAEGTFVGDKHYINTGNRVALFGGRWNHAGGAGLFFWALADDSSASYRNIGGRLVAYKS